MRQYPKINNNGIYQGMVDGIPGDIPGSFVSPPGIKTSLLPAPPTDEPGKWMDNGVEWVEVLPPSLADLQAMFTAAIQEYMDSFFRQRNYDGVLSAATYATSTNAKFAAEGQYAVEMRDAIWAKGYAIMDAVLAGEREIPSIEEVLAELPELVWPDTGPEAEAGPAPEPDAGETDNAELKAQA